MRRWKQIPYVLILLAVWAGLKAYDVSTRLNTVTGGLMLVAGVLVLAVEFFRSGDIGLFTFGIDQGFAVATVKDHRQTEWVIGGGINLSF